MRHRDEELWRKAVIADLNMLSNRIVAINRAVRLILFMLVGMFALIFMVAIK